MEPEPTIEKWLLETTKTAWIGVLPFLAAAIVAAIAPLLTTTQLVSFLGVLALSLLFVLLRFRRLVREKNKKILELEHEVSSLKSKLPVVVEKIVEKTVYKEAAPSNQLENDELKILRAMAAKGCGVYKDEMQGMCGAHQTKFDYYFHRLLIEFRLLEVQPSGGSRYTAYRLSQVGRAFVIKNKLIE